MSDMAGTAAAPWEDSSPPDTAVAIPFGGSAPVHPTATHPTHPTATHPTAVTPQETPAPEPAQEPVAETGPVILPEPPVVPVPPNPPTQVLLDELEKVPASDPGQLKSWAESVGLTFEAPPEGYSGRGRPPGSGTGRAGWAFRLQPLMQHPGNWVKMSYVGFPKKAEQAGSQIKTLIRKNKLPGTDTGYWEVRTRRDLEANSSFLYVRFCLFTASDAAGSAPVSVPDATTMGDQLAAPLTDEEQAWNNADLDTDPDPDALA